MLVKDGLEATLTYIEDDDLMLKKGRYLWREKVLREAYWIQKLPPTISQRFPKVVSINPKEYSYLMQMIHAKNVAEALSIGELSAPNALQYWENGFEAFLNQRKNFSESIPTNWEYSLLDKVETRLHQLRIEYPSFAPLLDCHIIKVDDTEYLNSSVLLEKIKRVISLNKLSLLTPQYLILMHLDLQLTNILVKDDGIMIDPRGDTCGDAVYDLMKVIHYMDYEYVTKGYVMAERDEATDSKTPSFCLEFIGDDSTRIRDQAHLDLLRELDTLMHAKADYFQHIFGNHWQLRLWFYYATTFIGGTTSLVQHSNTNLIRRAVTRYVIGLIYLNRFLASYLQVLSQLGIKNRVNFGSDNPKPINFSEALHTKIVSAQLVNANL